MKWMTLSLASHARGRGRREPSFSERVKQPSIPGKPGCAPAPCEGRVLQRLGGARMFPNTSPLSYLDPFHTPFCPPSSQLSQAPSPASPLPSIPEPSHPARLV